MTAHDVIVLLAGVFVGVTGYALHLTIGRRP